MRYAIPTFAGRISPRCTIADTLVLVDVHGTSVIRETLVSTPEGSWDELLRKLTGEHVDILVCGGISRDARLEIQAYDIQVVDNVVATVEAVLAAIRTDRLHSGFGLMETDEEANPSTENWGGPHAQASDSGSVRVPTKAQVDSIPDCLDCEKRFCLYGEGCPLMLPGAVEHLESDRRHMLEVAVDMSCEPERIHCRLTELVYFGLQMGYRRLGIAFCWDLLEPARILVEFLRRFFLVVPVCCQINDAHSEGIDNRGKFRQLTRREAVCNPAAQANVLDAASCDLNVMVGLCMGADCIFSQISKAPVTTLFVKDRSLAHNPIAALYSDRYLNEVLRSSAPV